jgi:PAS domain S-box-containing protein
MDTPAATALRIVNHIPAMVAYWDENERCVFANAAYLEWFGRTPEQMIGITLEQLLGPIYPKNLPYIKAALAGERQVFERQIPIPSGGVRESIATYTPDIVDGRVRGFSIQVADVTGMKDREALLVKTLKERDEALAEVRTLRGLLPICAGCKSIRDQQGRWHSVESYVSARTEVNFSHGMCPDCIRKYYPGLPVDQPTQPR